MTPADGTQTDRSTRRRFVKLAGTAGLLGGVSGILGRSGSSTAARGGATFIQETPDPEYTIKLGGKVEAWKGIAPEAIAGEDNPTLELTEGETYTLYWVNVDGQPHNIAIEDSDGNKLQVLNPLDVSEDEVQITTVAEGTPGTETTGTETAGTETTAAETMGTETTAGTEAGTGTPGELVTETEIISGVGRVQGVEFEASSEMATYRCLVHPTTMVGDVSVE